MKRVRQKKNTIWYHLYVESKKVKLVETVHGGMVVTRHRGTGGIGELLKGINLQLEEE